MQTPVYSCKYPSHLLVAVAFGGLMLASCSKKPEDMGRAIAELKCDCDNQQDKLTYDRKTTLAAEIKNNSIMTDGDFERRERELRRPIHAADSICRVKAKQLLTDAEIAFPQESDRQTMGNMAEAVHRQCETEREAQAPREEIDLYALRKNLLRDGQD